MKTRSKKKNKIKNKTLLIPTQIIEEKLAPINIDYNLLQFDALKFVLGVRLRRRSLPNFNFFNVNPQI